VCFSLLEKSSLLLLITSNLEVLATLDRLHRDSLAGVAQQSKDDLLGGLGLLVEDRLGLSTVSRLFAVVSSLPLSVKRGLSRLVLGHCCG